MHNTCVVPRRKAIEAYLAAGRATEKYAYSRLCIWSEEKGIEKEFTLSSLISFVGGNISWSADGKAIFAKVRQQNDYELLRVDATTGESQVIATNHGGPIHDLTPDGKIIYTSKSVSSAAGGSSIPGGRIFVRRDLESGVEQELYRLENPDGLPTLTRPLSPDGKWIAIREAMKGQSSQEDRQGIVIVPTKGGPAREIFVTHRLGLAFWAPDSKHILRLDEDSITWWEISLDGGLPRKLGQMTGRYPDLIFHPDGKRFAFTSWGDSEAGVYVLENLPPLRSAGK